MWNMRSPPFRYSITKNRWLCIEGWKEGGKEDRIEEMERQRDGGRGRKGERKGKMVQEGGGSEGRRKVGRKKELK